jgi:cation transport regulator ChaC
MTKVKMKELSGPELIWYFAYGSNLSKAQMHKRVGQWQDAKKAHLPCWRLVFNVPSRTWKGGTANILETGNPEDIVNGAVYRIDTDQLKILTEQFEHVPPRAIKVVCEGNEIPAITYTFKQDRPQLIPDSFYIKKIILGMKDHGYSDSLIIACVISTGYKNT